MPAGLHMMFVISVRFYSTLGVSTNFRRSHNIRFQENQFISYYLTRNELTDDQSDVAKLMCALLRPFIAKGQKRVDVQDDWRSCHPTCQAIIVQNGSWATGLIRRASAAETWSSSLTSIEYRDFYSACMPSWRGQGQNYFVLSDNQ